jgi:hypothetical protein
MISLGINAQQPQAVLLDSGVSCEQENAYRRWPVSF